MAKLRAIELYFSVAQIATNLMHSKTWVNNQIKAGEFGDYLREGGPNGQIRVPVSGYLKYLEKHNVRVSDLAGTGSGEWRRRR